MELQKALDATKVYCNHGDLRANESKTKVIVSKTCRNVNAPDFYFKGKRFKLVDDMFSLIKNSRKLNLPGSFQLKLFDTLLYPIRMYVVKYLH